MTRPLDELLSRLSELEEKATKGPWGAVHNTQDNAWDIFADDTDEPLAIITDASLERAPHDARLIAALRNAFPALKQAIEELERDAERYRWLRDNANRGGDIEVTVADNDGDEPVWYGTNGKELDAAIDSALNEAGEKMQKAKG